MFNIALMLLGMVCGFVVFDESMDSSHVGYYMLGIGFVVVSPPLGHMHTTSSFSLCRISCCVMLVVAYCCCLMAVVAVGRHDDVNSRISKSIRD